MDLASPQIDTVSSCRYRHWLLVAAGVHLAVLATVIAWRTALPWHFPGSGEAVNFTQVLDPDWRVTAIEVTGVVLVAFLLFGQALVAVWGPQGRGAPPLALFGFPALFVLALAWMYPLWSADLFHYQADARTFWVFGDNPLTVPPTAHPYPLNNLWPDMPSPYGPIWTLLTGVPTLVSGDHLLAGLIGLKLLSGAFLLGCAWLLYDLVARVRPGWEATAVVLLAWNPFMLFRAVGSGHNDPVMMFFALLALRWTWERHWLSVFPALALSVLVKYVTGCSCRWCCCTRGGTHRGARGSGCARSRRGWARRRS